jgi:septal ring factor EnvC (AmiA/AmiB activator)
VIIFAEQLIQLKKQFLELLEKDLEFRRAVIGMLELEEILQRLRKHDEKFEEMLKRLDRHESELVKLREDFNKMLNVIIQIQEDQIRLRENYERLEKHINILEKSLKSLEGAMLRGFADISKFAGITFEEFVRNFLTEALRRSSEIPEGVELKKIIIDGEEINIFLENPLIVGEVTASAESIDEIMKLLRKAELVKTKYSKEPKKIMIILTAKRDIAKEIERIAEEKGVRLVIGKIIG